MKNIIVEWYKDQPRSFLAMNTIAFGACSYMTGSLALIVFSNVGITPVFIVMLIYLAMSSALAILPLFFWRRTNS